MSDIINEQKPPQSSSGDCWELVLQDMRDRRKLGVEKYGTPLQPFNGRDPLVDVYQEALDLCVYLRQAIEERARAATFTWHRSSTAESEVACGSKTWSDHGGRTVFPEKVNCQECLKAMEASWAKVVGPPGPAKTTTMRDPRWQMVVGTDPLPVEPRGPLDAAD